ncbi:MAG TPA: hypothetical protein EYG02_00740 [Henriciella marina]|uniref:hypothetical protein n=1 Tax=Henriciella sp. TaxID=1968823 RepID=UPI0017EE1DCD|nr:hypothetical protein [Henriciella sp.]HIG23988.1 hypothetical protein [Henriciella sp.]HIK63538.1 hypothetical protein [Henriciella marina]
MQSERPSPLASKWVLISFGLIVIGLVALQAGPALGGDLRGNDDMMRMQQVRDLLSGERGWYNVSQRRLLTPEGGEMHWSRLPDLFIAAIIFLLQPLIGTRMAEGVAATLWPMMQLGWILAMVAICLKRLGATLSGQLAGMFFLATSFALFNLVPGRIDHHGLGLALTLTGFAALLSPIRNARSAFLGGACVPVMLSVAIENLPAAALLIAGFSIAWIVRGGIEAGRLRIFGATLIVAALLTYVFDAPGAQGIRAVCDAYGQSHFVALLVGGAGLFVIATAAPSADTWRLRFALIATAGAVALATFIAINPSCLGNPYAGILDDVRTGWLSGVGEARNAAAVFADNAAQAVFYFGFGFAGVIAALICLLRAPDGLRLASSFLLAFCLLGFAISLWQLRAAMMSHAFAAIAGGLLTGFAFQHWRGKRGGQAALVLVLVALLASPAGWRLPGLVLPETEDETDAADYDCTSAAALAQVAAAPSMVVFTPIDLGAPLIYHTPHYATAAPYHRNVHALSRTLNIYTGPVSSAREKMSRSGATHLLYCPGLNEMAAYAERAPDGFAAALESGNIPNWLVATTPEENRTGDPILYSIVFDRN